MMYIISKIEIKISVMFDGQPRGTWTGARVAEVLFSVTVSSSGANLACSVFSFLSRLPVWELRDKRARWSPDALELNTRRIRLVGGTGL